MLRLMTATLAVGLTLVTTEVSAKLTTTDQFCGDRYCGLVTIRDVQPSRKRHELHCSHHGCKVAKEVVRHTKRSNVRPRLHNITPSLAKSPEGAATPLIAAARKYLGTNPTGWRSLWCARFMALIAPQAARKVKNPNFARDWAVLPKTAPKIGAVAVLARGQSGGHIGIVTGFDSHGNPRIISGNHGHRVGEGVYPRSRVIAWVSV